MKLSQFTPGVNRNYLQARVQAVDDPNAWGANQSGAEAANRAFAIGIGVYDKAQQQKIYNNVQDALNDYNQQINTLMYDENNGLAYTMQGKAAEGMQDAYTQAEQKIRADVAKRYGISTDFQMNLFRKEADPNVTSTLSTINKLQRQGKMEYAESQRAGDTANTKNAILQSPQDFETLYGSYEGRMRANYASLGMDELAIDNAVRGQMNQLAESTLSSMADKGDNSAILDLTPKLRAQGADETILQKYEKFARGQNMAKSTKESVTEWTANDPSLLRLTPEEAWEKYRASHPFQMPTKADGTALGAIGNTVAQKLAAAGIEGWNPVWGTAVAAHESARGSAAPGNNYFGYKWTGHGNYQDLQTEEVDENGNRYTTTARFQVYDSPEQSGEAYADWLLNNCSKEELQSVKSAGDLARLMKKHGYYTDDENAYASSLDSLAKEYEGPSGTPEERDAWEEKEKQAFIAEFENAQKTRKEAVQARMSDLQHQIYVMADAGAGTADMLAQVDNAAELHPEIKDSDSWYILRASLMDRQRGASGTSRGNGGAGKASENELYRVKAAISAGDIRSESEMEEYIRDSGLIISPSQLDSLRDYYRKTESGEDIKILATKEEMSQKMFGTKDAITQTQWGMALEAAKAAGREYEAENKRKPTQQELVNILQKQLTQNIDTGSGMKSAADLRAMGIALIQSTDDPQYRTVTFADGSSYDVHVYELQRLMNGEITEDNLFFQRQNGMMS